MVLSPSPYNIDSHAHEHSPSAFYRLSFARWLPLRSSRVHLKNQSRQRPFRTLERDEAVRLNNLGTAYVNQQVFEKASTDVHQAVQADPNLVFARLNEGIALGDARRQKKKAKAAFEEVASANRENPRGWYNLGLLEKSIGDGKASIEAFQKASQLAPNDPDAAYFLGMALLQDGQNEAAVPVFQRVLKLNPFHASAEFALARAYRNLGQMDQAKIHQVSFDHIRKAKLGAPITLAYGDQGPLSLVVTVSGAEGEAGRRLR